ncbi:PRC-barrel domain-containing protein [Aliiroseovarius sp. YM-037]|uniref:PRC-barrel domain-containing protein n=1 Tax=Aliiroseovarius sp. YM-037 TaxID=3341728 RepID=UPI003A8088AA
MLTNTRHLVLVGLLAALPSSIAAQTADQPDVTTDSGAEVTDAAPEAEAPPAPVEGQIILQSENTILADDLIGSRVYSEAGDTVGDINDLIVNLDGTVDGVVIGVGGFLGMGEKAVAVEMSALNVATDAETGSVRLMLSATREDLDAAPVFKTAADQKSEAQAEEMQQQLDEGIAPADTATANN